MFDPIDDQQQRDDAAIQLMLRTLGGGKRAHQRAARIGDALMDAQEPLAPLSANLDRDAVNFDDSDDHSTN